MPTTRLCLLVLLIATPAVAAPPTLTSLAPRSAQRGKSVVVQVGGTNLTPATRLVLPFEAEQKHLADPKPNPALVRLELTPKANVEPGIYPVRVKNEEGLSGLTFFRIDTLPIGAEIEDNNTFEKAQKIAWPIAVEGQCAGGDVDFFRITAKKGQRIAVEVESARLGSGVLPQVRVSDEKKRLLASDDSQSLAGDVRVQFTAPADGDIAIELSDSRYRGGAPAFYRLRINEQETFDEVFPLGGRRGETIGFRLRGGSLSKPLDVKQKLADGPFSSLAFLSLPGALSGSLPPRLRIGDFPELLRADDSAIVEIKPPLTINGRLTKQKQTDKASFSVAAGSRWRFVVEAESLGSRLDGVLQVSDEKGRVLLEADDVDLPAAPGQQGIRTVDPSGELTVPTGVKELVVSLRDQRDRGGVGFGYRLTIEPLRDDFNVRLPIAEVNVPRGGALALSVPITRRGYTGPISLSVPNLPPGYRVTGGRIPAMGTLGVLCIAADDAATDPAEIALEGKATLDGKEARRLALLELILARESGAAGVYALPKLALARTSAAPFSMQVPASLTLIRGYAAEVTVKLTRAKGQEKLPITLTAIVPGPNAGPTGFTLRPQPASVDAEVKLNLTPGITVPEGQTDLAIQAQARVGTSDIRLSSPALPVLVKSPFAIALDGPVELKPGSTVKVAGKLVREAVCKEPVRLTVRGLPPGVTLTPPKPVAANENTFVLELKVGPKPGAGKIELLAAATIGGQNFNLEPVVVAVK